MLKTGTEFIAKSKCNSYKYRFVGINPAETYGICLLNLDNGLAISVENEWFRQRKITITKEAETHD